MKKRWTVYIPEFFPPVEPQKKIIDPVAEIEMKRAATKEDLISILQGVEGVLISVTTKMTEDVIKASPNLKVISKYGVGVENIDIKAATEMGILVTNVPGINSNSVAEFTIGIMLALLRHIQTAKHYMKKGGWRDEGLIGTELRDKTIGIIGYGSIGRGVVKKLQGFDVKEFLIFSETQRETGYSNAVLTDLPSLLRKADIISIHKTLTAETEGLIGARELKMMKESAYLINTSRGPIIEEKMLIRALKEGWIRGAALDVFAEEPISQHNPLLDLDNAVLAPHLGGSTWEARNEGVVIAAKNLVYALEGKTENILNIVNPEVLTG